MQNTVRIPITILNKGRVEHGGGTLNPKPFRVEGFRGFQSCAYRATARVT